MSVLEEWKAQVTAFQKSGLSQTKWGQQQGVAKGTFSYRLSKIRKTLIDASFIELKPKAKSASIKIQYKEFSIFLDKDFNEEVFLKIVRSLNKEGSC